MALRVVCAVWIVTAAATWCSLLLTSNYLLSLQTFRDELFTTVDTRKSLLLMIRSPPPTLQTKTTRTRTRAAAVALDSPSVLHRSVERSRQPNCTGRYVYMYDLPSKFNQQLLEQCSSLSIWTNMCPHIANAGLGQPITFNDGHLLYASTGWYATNQFTAELIFHNSMKQYECLTQNPASATAFYVPFYAGLDMSRHIGQVNTTVRDELGVELGQWLESRAEWQQQHKYVKNHFMVVGRISWDFMRSRNSNKDWGNDLLGQPFTKKMSVLLVEAHPWHQNEYGIPYPTYFHPSSTSELHQYQQRLRMIRKSSRSRKTIIGFVGGSKSGNGVRDEVMRQCGSSKRCQMLNCSTSSPACHRPDEVMKLLLESTFCLQPRGDSFTRRSVFDSLIAACIPVVFNEHTMSSQYRWNRRLRGDECSVVIAEEELMSGGSMNLIEERLLGISVGEIERMQERIIEMLPVITYADPRLSWEELGFTDAFGDVVRGITDQIGAEQEHLAAAAAASAVVGKERKRRRRRKHSNTRQIRLGLL